MNLPSGPQGRTTAQPTTKTTSSLLSSEPPARVPTFSTLLVLPYTIDPLAYSKIDSKTGLQAKGGQGRAEAEGEIVDGFRRLIQVLQGAGLWVTTREAEGMKRGKEVWVFVGASEKRLAELAAREKWVGQGVFWIDVIYR
jgi:hypothetical protein